MNQRQIIIGNLKTAQSHLVAARRLVEQAYLEGVASLPDGECREVGESLRHLAQEETRLERATEALTAGAPAVNSPRCGGNGIALGSNPKVLKCEGCDGYYTREPITRAEGLTLVNFNEWHKGRSLKGAERYFDFSISGGLVLERVHGWFDIHSRRMTQSG
jgi:hypothetical protein